MRMPTFPLARSPLAIPLLREGCADFDAAIRWVHALPYGRNTNRAREDALTPVIRIEITDAGTRIGLAPAVASQCEMTIVDTHWLALPKGRVVVSLTEGSDHCATLSP